MKKLIALLLACACGGVSTPGAPAPATPGTQTPGTQTPPTTPAPPTQPPPATPTPPGDQTPPGTQPPATQPPDDPAPMPPSAVTAPHVLAASEVPAAPQPAMTCEAAPAGATVHRPGPCSAVGFVASVFDEPGVTKTTRVTNTWLHGQLTAAATEQWGTYPSIQTTDYERITSQSSFDQAGRLFETAGGYDYYEQPRHEDSTSFRTITDYSYEGAGKLVSSTGRYRYAVLYNGDPTPSGELPGSTLRYFVDARGTAFVSSDDNVGDGITQQPTKFALFPDGVVQSTSIGTSSCGGGCHSGNSTKTYDERGTLLSDTETFIDRFGNQFPTTTTNTFEGGRLVSVTVTNTLSVVSTTTLYGYDGAGNNTTRTKTDASGALLSNWTGTYDEAGNLVCELETDPSGALLDAVHYDYGCF